MCQANQPSSPPGPEPAKVAENALRDVDSASSASATLWISYLFVLFYLLVAAASVTHRDLLVESPVKLPFLSVELPLVGFFRVVPLLFVIVHTYVLLHFVFLSERILRFQHIVATTPGLRSAWELPADVFVTVLAAPDNARRGPVDWLLRLIAWVSLIIGPVLLLIFMQLQFLPYHDAFTTWLQRGAILVDLALLWALWPRIVTRRTDRPFGWMRHARLARGIAASAAVLLVVFGIATFPGEALHEIPFVPFRNTIVAEQIEDATAAAASPWVNRLVLSGADLVDRKVFDTPAKLLAAPPVQKFRGRHLEGAVFTDATLPRTDFTNAHLEGAVFTRAKMQGAWFDAAFMIGARLDHAAAQGASFFETSMQAASLDAADLQGAAMAGAHLGSASLEGAHLQAVSLAGADLRGASLVSADLRGANLAGTLLQGASFAAATLTGASFYDAYIWRTDFRLVVAAKPGFRIAGHRPATAKPPCMGQDKCQPPDDTEALHGTIDRFVLDLKAKDKMLARLEQHLDPAVPIPLEAAIASSADVQEHAGEQPDVDEEELKKLWRELACTAEGAPFVLISFLGTIDDEKAVRFQKDSPARQDLARELDGPGCAAKLVRDDATTMRLLELLSPREPTAPFMAPHFGDTAETSVPGR